MVDRTRSSTLAVAREHHFARAAAQFSQFQGWVRAILIAVLIALGLRSFVYEPFNIPSESMQPGLLVGDYLFVAKWPYGYSRYSLPLGLPLWNGRVFEGQAERGDVVVFKSPRDKRTDYIKRIVGVPGDTVRMVDGRLELNGVLLPKARLGDFVTEPVAGGGCYAGPGQPPFPPATGLCRYPRYSETLPEGRSYQVLDEVAHDVRDTTPLVTVPAGHYFVLGDNRDDSADSRLEIADGGVGLVPAENVVGRADRIFFSTGASGLGAVRPDRIGTRL